MQRLEQRRERFREYRKEGLPYLSKGSDRTLQTAPPNKAERFASPKKKVVKFQWVNSLDRVWG